MIDAPCARTDPLGEPNEDKGDVFPSIARTGLVGMAMLVMTACGGATTEVPGSLPQSSSTQATPATERLEVASSELTVKGAPEPTSTSAPTSTQYKASLAEAERESRTNAAPMLELLSPAELGRLSDIIDAVMVDPRNLTDEVHAEFWRLFARAGIRSDADRAAFRASVGDATEYQYLLWRDVLVSMGERRPVKSPERGAIEARVRTREPSFDARIRANDALIRDILAGRAVSLAEGSELILMDEAMVETMVSLLAASVSALEQLFTPPSS